MKSKLPPTLQHSIHHLLLMGISQREVAKRLGISRRQVSNVAKIRKNVTENGETAQFVRCPECGARVVMPCLRCRIGRWRGTFIIHVPESPPELDLQLPKRAHKRYLEVKK